MHVAKMVRSGVHGMGVHFDNRNLRPYAVRVIDPMTKKNKLIIMCETREEAQACADTAFMIRFVKYGIKTRLNNEYNRATLLEEVVNLVHEEFKSSGDVVNSYHYYKDPILRAMIRDDSEVVEDTIVEQQEEREVMEDLQPTIVEQQEEREVAVDISVDELGDFLLDEDDLAMLLAE